MRIYLTANTKNLDNFKTMLRQMINNIDAYNTLGDNTNEGIITHDLGIVRDDVDKIYFSTHSNEIQHEQHYGC
jgi:hypothetical protein